MPPLVERRLHRHAGHMVIYAAEGDMGSDERIPTNPHCFGLIEAAAPRFRWVEEGRRAELSK